MSRITSLEDEIHELKVKLEKAKFKTADRERYIGKLNGTILKDRETLAFYADKRNYEVQLMLDPEGEMMSGLPMDKDIGNAARKRLGNENVVSEKYRRTRFKIGDDWLVLVSENSAKKRTKIKNKWMKAALEMCKNANDAEKVREIYDAALESEAQ